MKKFLFYIFLFPLFLFPLPVCAGGFAPFLDKASYITGTFGEFRRSHLHAGIDISTHGRIGIPVHSAAGGTVCRVKIQYKGFGRAVYIRLKDGRYLVYAHLDRFAPFIERFVEKKRTGYEMDLYPKKDLPVKKGDIIGWSGDTGGVPPHLHVELRDKYQRPLNMLTCGFYPGEDNKPVIAGLAVCDPETSYCKAFYPAGHIPSEIEIAGQSAFGLSVYIPSHGNRLGVYRIDVRIDNAPFFGLKMDRFSYREFGDNFAVYNRDLYVNKNIICYNLFQAFGTKLPFYGSDGIVSLPEGRHHIVIKASGAGGKSASIGFDVIYKSAPGHRRQKAKDIWVSEDGLCSVRIDQYYPLDIKIKAYPPAGYRGELSPASNIYTIGPARAVFKSAVISIKPFNTSGRTALYVRRGNRWRYMKTNTAGEPGQFALFTDTTPPSIDVISSGPVFRARITDGGSGINYSKLALYIDGKKVIHKYSMNSGELYYRLPPGRHNIVCTAEDNAGINHKLQITNYKQ